MSVHDALEHARGLLRSGEHAACEALCTHVLAQIPNQPGALHLSAILAHRQGRPDEAIMQLEQLVDRMPGDPGFRLDLANLLIEGGRSEAALPHLQKALRIDRRSAITWNSQAVACLRLGRLDECEAAITAGLAIEPERDELLGTLALLRTEQGRSDEAIDLMTAAAERAPDQPERWKTVGEALTTAGRHAEAAEAFRRRVLAGARTADACNDFGLALLRCERLDDSIAAFLHGLEFDSDSVELHRNLALALHRSGRHRESIEHARAVLALEPVSAPLLRMMSESHLALGERGAALEVLRQLSALEPDDPETMQRVEALASEIAAAEPPVDEALQEVAEVEVIEKVADAADVAERLEASFDASRASLQSRAPQLVAAALAAAARRLPPAPEILDAGCGAGPCGPLVKPLAGRLVGVDAAAAMLERARARAVYDALEESGLAEFLERSPQSFDAIVSADAVDGFGDLKAFAAGAARALRPRGVLIFTVLALDDGAADHALLVNGRHAHSRAYVQRALQTGGFAPTMITSARCTTNSTPPCAAGW